MRSIFLMIILLVSNGYTATLATQIEERIAQTLPQATVAVFVKDAANGQIIYRRNADKLLAPASTTKLFTAAAALLQLKPDFYFTTTLASKKNNIYLIFSGSPSLTSENLQKLLQQLKKQKINTIKGDFIIDTSRFQAPDYPSGLSYDDFGWYYAAPDTAAIIDENAVDYEFTTAKAFGAPVQVKAKDNGAKIPLMANIITVNNDTAKKHCNLNITIAPQNHLQLYGCLAQRKNSMLVRLAVTDPLSRAQQLVRHFLELEGIHVNGHIRLGKAPGNALVLAQLKSKDLAKLLTHMLMESDNLYANAISKQLGFAITGEGSYKQGVFAIQEILEKNIQIDSKQVLLYDGMGTRYNLSTAEQIVHLLSALYHNKELNTIWMQSLPQSAVSGTLKARMQNSSLAKIVFAKTGTMHDISSLSGYIIAPQKPALIFTILINGVNEPITKAKQLEEDILQIIYEHMQEMA